MDKKMMMVVQRYGLVLVQICCAITLYASDGDKRVSSFQKCPRFESMLRKISDERMAEEHFELYRKRAQLDCPQISIQEQIHRLDGDIQYAYEQRVSVDKQLASCYVKENEFKKTEEELSAKIEKLKREKEIITRRMEGYGKELKKYQEVEDDELYSIMMSSGSRQLEHCLHRIAIMDERKDELGQEIGPLYFNISSLERERDGWNRCSEEAHKKRAELVQIHKMCFDDGTRPLFDQFDELIELSIATAYTCPVDIFDQLAVKTEDACECAWCFALLKVFQDKNPTYQQMMRHIQNRERYCDEQQKCTLCDCLSAGRAKVFSKIAKHCLQQLKHDKVYRVCLGCSDSLIKKENLLRTPIFVDYIEQIIPDYIAFRLNYLELFYKYDAKLNTYSQFSSQLSQIKDLLFRYSDHMEDLKHLLNDKSNLQYLKKGVKNMKDSDSAFDGFLTRKELSERATCLLIRAQMQAEKILREIDSFSCQSSSSSSSSSSLSSSDD